MKQWRRKAATVIAAAILCSVLPVMPTETGALLPVLAVSSESSVTFNESTHTLILGGQVIQAYEQTEQYGIIGTGVVLPYGVFRENVQNIVIESDAILPENSSFLFTNFSNLKTFSVAKGFTSPNCTNMMGMFMGCTSLKDVYLNDFDTSAVTDVRGMFIGCTSLEELDLHSFDTSKVKAMTAMFGNCQNLKKLDLRSFDTSEVTDMSQMFKGCEKLTELDLKSFDTSKVTTMSQMFEECKGFTELDLSSFHTSNVTNMSSMFQGCTGLTKLDLRHFDTSNVALMSMMFYNCSSLTELDLRSFNTSKVTSTNDMFSKCQSLPELDLRSFDTSNVENMQKMFYQCTNLENIIVSDKWSTSGLINSNISMFEDCPKLRGKNGTVYNSNHKGAYYARVDGSSGLPGYFTDDPCTYQAESGTLTLRGEITQTLDSYGISDGIKLPSGVSISDVQHIVVKDNAVFPADSSYLFVGMNHLKDIAFEDGFSTSNVTNMDYMFVLCSSLTELDLRCFDTSSVLSMRGMFSRCTQLKKLNVSSFDTTNVTSMFEMFNQCAALTALDLSSFTTAKTTIMEGMFEQCTSLTALDLSSFDTSKVTNMRNMFFQCSELERIAVSEKWNTDSVTSSDKMFYLCSKLKGKNGTAYDSSHVDASYARLDGRNGQPGYFSDKEPAVITTTNCYPLVSNGANKVHVSFRAAAPAGGEILDHGLIYYNSGTVIHTADLTLKNVGICGIKLANAWSANITDNGTGVTAVGFVTFKDQYGFVTTQYTDELGGSYKAMTDAANRITLTRHENKALISGGKNKVYVGFTANIPSDYSVEDYGLIYYNSGNVITTPYLKLENVGVSGIQKAKYWSANITDIGYGVTAAGFVKVRDKNGYKTVLYTDELGSSFAAVTREAAAKAVTFKQQENKPVNAGGKNKVYVGFSADIRGDYTLEDYGLIYYNSGNVIHTEHLTFENIGICGIQKAKYWSANITDIGYGVVCVGFVKVKDKNGCVTTLYTGELGNSYKAMTDAAKNVTLTRLANKAVTSGSKQKVFVGFSANVPGGYTVVDYGLIYYNSGTVITTPYLTLENVGICGIQKAKYWSANITDNGYGVTCVGFIKVKDKNGYATTLYTGELGAKYADLVG